MKSLSEDELFLIYPELGDIAKRLGDSEAEANRINTERVDNDPFKRTTKHADYFCISDFHKDERWLSTVFTPKWGRDEFVEMASSIINSRSPDALRVKIWNGKPKSRNQVASETVVVPITARGKTLMIEQQSYDPSQVLNGIEKAAEQARFKMDEFSRNPSYDKGDLRYQLLQRDFEDKLKELNHQNALGKLKDHYEGQIREFQDTIADLEGEIEELNEQITESDGALGSLTTKVEQQQDPPAVDLLARVATRALTGVLQSQPKFTSALTGLSEDELKAIWVKENPMLTSGDAVQGVNAAASFDEGIESGFEGKAPEHVTAIKAIYEFCKALPFPSFQKLYTIFAALSDDENGGLDMAMTDKILALTYSQQSQDKKEVPAQEV